MSANLPPTGQQARIPRAALPPPCAPEMFVGGSPNGVRQLGLVVKRTYSVSEAGACELAPIAEQERVFDEPKLYRMLEPPEVSPLGADDDTKAFRPATDLVVQGRAHTYGEPRFETTVALSFGGYRREIAVKGDRRIERGRDGRLRFTSPEPFESMGLFYSHAYGGFDAVAAERRRNPDFEALAAARPEWQLAAQTPFHYPRNPAGRGFLCEDDDASIAAARVPNLEFPFDPLTPERMLVGAPEHWVDGPVPAGFDWFHPSWFPRSAYLGCPAALRGSDRKIAEIEWGWAAPDLRQIPSMLDDLEAPVRPEFFQAASPGLSFPTFDPGETLVLQHMHPEHPEWRVRLPGLVPRFSVALAPPAPTPLTPHLNAVVVRPEMSEVVMIWCLSTPSDRRYTPAQLANVRAEGGWTRTT